VTPSGSSGNNYQPLKNLRVTATGTTANTSTDTVTVIDTVTDCETATAIDTITYCETATATTT
jgi:hypothetical protein